MYDDIKYGCFSNIYFNFYLIEIILSIFKNTIYKTLGGRIMKKFFTIVTVALLSISILFIGTDNASAATSKDSKNKKLDLEFLQEEYLKNIRKKHPKAVYVDITPEEYIESLKPSSELRTIMGPAPALTLLETVAAVSTKYPTYEFFSELQLSSVYDHGGEQFYIVTEEHGYGYSRFAKFNGVALTQAKSAFIDFEGDTIVDGWHIWWDASGNEVGQFTYQNTSTNYPWNTMSDSIYIK